jgi:hypothetical protein
MSTIPANQIEHNRSKSARRSEGDLDLCANCDGEHEAGAEEANMHNNSTQLRVGATKRCPICDGRFGLVRHYSWRTALCSKKCVDRFRARQEADRKWLSWLRAA